MKRDTRTRDLLPPERLDGHGLLNISDSTGSSTNIAGLTAESTAREVFDRLPPAWRATDILETRLGIYLQSIYIHLSGDYAASISRSTSSSTSKVRRATESAVYYPRRTPSYAKD